MFVQVFMQSFSSSRCALDAAPPPSPPPSPYHVKQMLPHLSSDLSSLSLSLALQPLHHHTFFPTSRPLTACPPSPCACLLKPGGDFESIISGCHASALNEEGGGLGVEAVGPRGWLVGLQFSAALTSSSAGYSQLPPPLDRALFLLPFFHHLIY